MGIWRVPLITDDGEPLITETGEQLVAGLEVNDGAPHTTCRVEYAPGFSPWNLPADGDWELLAVPYSYTRGRGRPDRFSEMDAGTATIEVPDLDGAIFTAGLQPPSVAGACGPLTPIRIVLTIAEVDYTRFTGYVLDPPKPGGSRRGRTAIIVATDWLGIMAGVDLPVSIWAAWVGATSPVIWWRDRSTAPQLNPAQNDRIHNDGSTGADGDGYTIDDPEFYVPYQVTDRDLVTGDPSNSWETSREIRSTVAATWGTTYQIAVWIQLDQLPTATGTFAWGSDSAGGLVNRWLIQVTTAGAVNARIYNTAGTQIGSVTATGDHCDGEPHMVFISVSPTEFRISTDLGGATAVPTGTPSSSGFVTVAKAHWLLPATVNWSNLAIWPGSILPLPSPADWVAGELGGIPTRIWIADSVAARVAHLIMAAGLPVPTPTFIDADLTESITYQGIEDLPGGQLGEALLALAAGFLGTAVMTRDGRLRIRDFGALDDEVDLPQHRAHVASLTDNPFPPDIDDTLTPYARLAGTFKAGTRVAAPPQLPVVRYTPSGPPTPRLEAIVNEVKITDADGGVLTWIDRASIDEWGPRPKPLAVEHSVSSSWVRTAARQLVEQRAQLRPEIQQVTVTPTTTAAAQFVIDVDLEDPVHFHASDPTGAVVLIDGSFRVQSESESWDGKAWSATYSLDQA